VIKTLFKLILCIIVYAIVFIVANAFMPFSQGFKELAASGNSSGILFILVSAAWVCFTIFFIMRNTHWNGIKLFFNIVLVVFFIQSFMTQIETLFFGYAFPAFPKLDIIFITIAGLFPVLAVVLLLLKFFQNKDSVFEKNEINIKSTLIRLSVIGVIYLFVYMVFGYFVAWQFEELRIFYSGSSEKLSFWGQTVNNFKINPIIFPFQIIRGILFGAAIIPIRKMVNKNKITFIISVCLLYLCTAVQLIIPNALFPDMVRLAHLVEMSSSMLLFGVMVGNILWPNKFIVSQTY
jgi:hypothetical protein